ncbi:MAG: dTMP kinase [Candidatus Rariloculaceae bacterium]
MPNAFVTLEGTEGVGKSTSLAFIEQILSGAGHHVVVTREPGGTQLGEQIRNLILEGNHQYLSAEIEALLMFAARAQHLNEVIRPALADGAWVLCDRFTDATFAYQGGGRGVSAGFLTSLKVAIQGNLEPDLTLLFDAPIEIGMARIAKRKPDHFEREDREFFERVRKGYLNLVARFPDRIKLINADQSITDVQRELRHHIDKLLETHMSHE